LSGRESGPLMNAERTLIAAVVFLAIGLGLIFGYTHGTVGFNAAYPVSGASLQASINTTGMPAMTGFASTVLGLLLLVLAFVQAIVAQVLLSREPVKQ
jgi:hypothetical protein